MSDLRVLRTDQVPAALLQAVRELVFGAFAGRFSEDDWAHGLGGQHVLVSEGDRVVAHASVVPRVLEVAGRPLRTGYLEAVATDPARQGSGLGSRAVEAATGLVREDFELGALSSSAVGFYERLGWERWQGPTYVRAGEREVRTEDEDDGVLVLRFGPSAELDLRSPISCEARAGDDW